MVVETSRKAGYTRCLKSLKRGGPLGSDHHFRRTVVDTGDIARQQWISITGAAKIIGGLPRILPGDLGFLKSLIEAGELRTVIDRSYSLDYIAEAFRYAEAGHKTGHVVIDIASA